MTARRYHRFSVDEYDRLTAIGILTEHHRVELIHGEIVEKTAIGDRHAYSVDALAQLTIPQCGSTAWVRVQNPIRLADSKPEPDVVLALRHAHRYRTSTPVPSDILL